MPTACAAADARDNNAYKALLGGCKAGFVFTNPPYNVPIGGNVSGLGSVRHRTMNGTIFVEYVRQSLVPSLRPGDIVIVDNLPAHKRDEVSQIIEAAGAGLIYLPPYSPDLNPIEQSFAKLKAHLRKAKERTVPALYDRIGEALGTFRASEFPNYFRKSGYAPI